VIVPDSHFVPSKQQVALRSDRCSSSNLDGVSVHEECGESWSLCQLEGAAQN